jgi:tRNA (cytidine56-2'-O)-methyltransferase
MNREIVVFRLGHRLPRDERISTHVALVARAFGASSIIYSGQKDSSLEESVSRICDKWGSNTKNNSTFTIEYEEKEISRIKKMKNEGFFLVHLTMYGAQVDQIKRECEKEEKILIIVGGEAVPSEIFRLSNANISVTNQPHSEVAALAIALDRIYSGEEMKFDHFKGSIEIEPSKIGKKIIKKKQ